MEIKPIDFSVDSKDIRYTLFDLVRIQELFSYEPFRHLDRDQVEDMLVQAERMAVELISPLNKIADRNPPKYEDGKVIMPAPFHSAFRKFCEAGWIPMTLGKEAGGLGLPESLGTAIKEMQVGACCGFTGFASLTFGALHLIESFGTERLKRLFVNKMMKGEFTGTMCLTEPGAGSFLADIKTRAKKKGDRYLIKGTKMFIGTGEHDLTENKIHCVLARIESASDGYAGISLFVVPKYRVNDDGTLGTYNDVFCGGIEDKMGHQGAPTATLHFGDNDDCEGWLLGEEGQGLAHMFQMMNEARLGIAVQGQSQAAGVYQMALSYAKARIQGLSYKRRKGDPTVQVPIIEHPDVRRNLMFMKSVVEGCRKLNIQTGLYIDLAKVQDDEREREYYQDLVEILTPICKSYASDMGFKVTETAVQIFGGYGYTKDYLVEQYLRDVKVASIYEGTNGIQAIDLQRRKLNLKQGQLFQNLCHEMDEFIGENHEDRLFGASIAELKRAKEKLIEMAEAFRVKKEKDPGLPLCVAKPFLDVTGHVLITWMLLKSAVLANSFLENTDISETDRAFYQGKIHTAQFAVVNFLPRVHAVDKTVSSWDRSILDMDIAGF